MKHSVLFAVIITILVVFWFASGSLFSSDKTLDNEKTVNAPPSSEELSNSDKLVKVRVNDLTAELMVDDITVTGRTSAVRKVDLKSEINGQIVKILTEKGSTVKKGDVLAKLDIKDRSANVSKARELLKQRQIQYDAAKNLQAKGFNSKVKLAEARAQIELARASLKSAQIELSNIDIKAPFDGVIDNKYIEIGDFASIGQNIFRIIDLNPIKVIAFVTEKQIMQLSLGSEVDILFTGGDKLKGKLTYISSAADPKTRTFEIEVSAINDDYLIKEGLTADITIPLKEQKAYRISPAILSLRDDGIVGVKIVDENNMVKFVPINLIKDTTDYLWVSGLPEKVRLIILGQEFVTDGQKVDPVITDGDGLL